MKNLLFALLIFCSCKKEGTPTPPTDNTSTNTALLLGKWQLSASAIYPSYDVDGNGTKETDRLNNMPLCSRTFIFNFTTSFDGAIKTSCSESYKTFYWNLTNYGSLLNWHTGSNADTKEKIITINSTTLQTESSIYPPDGLTYTITNTYTKI